jgi:isocitrate lyase
VGQTKGMQQLGIFDEVSVEIGDIIVADIDEEHVPELLKPDQVALKKLIRKE